MPLIDEVRARYSTEVLVSVSNPQLSSATTEDTTRSGNAVLDVQARFKMQGITYDNTVDTHVMVGCQGVIARLMVMTAHPGRVREIVRVDLPRPRAFEMHSDERFISLRDHVRDIVREEAAKGAFDGEAA